jgi:hypothetical protein
MLDGFIIERCPPLVALIEIGNREVRGSRNFDCFNSQMRLFLLPNNSAAIGVVLPNQTDNSNRTNDLFIKQNAFFLLYSHFPVPTRSPLCVRLSKCMQCNWLRLLTSLTLDARS